MTLAFERLSHTFALLIVCCTALLYCTWPWSDLAWPHDSDALLHFVLGCGYVGATILNSEFAACEIHSEYCIRLRDVSSQGLRQ